MSRPLTILALTVCLLAFGCEPKTKTDFTGNTGQGVARTQADIHTVLAALAKLQGGVKSGYAIVMEIANDSATDAQDTLVAVQKSNDRDNQVIGSLEKEVITKTAQLIEQKKTDDQHLADQRERDAWVGFKGRFVIHAVVVAAVVTVVAYCVARFYFKAQPLTWLVSAVEGAKA